MQALAPARAGAGLEQRFGNAIADHGGFAFQGNAYGDINFPGQSEDDRCLADLRGTASKGTDPRLDKKRIEQTKGGLLKDSYRWILDNDDFRRWQNNQDSQLLWIKGDPGKGKTMLLCGIIDELGSTTADDRHSSHLAYFFCQAGDSRTNNATAVLRGLVYLLVDQQRALLPYVRKKYDHAGIHLFEDINSWVAISEILTSILQDSNLQTTYLIVDALDECETDRLKLLDFIVQNLSVSSCVKWIVSSRNWHDIERRLELVRQGVRLSLELNAKSVSIAVKTYIEQKVCRLAELNKYKKHTEDAVRDYLSLNARDTFLWVALVCDRLKVISDRKTLKELNAFPPGLDELYSRMITQVYEMDDKDDVDLCKQVLAIVAMAYRPVTLDELASFIEPPDNDAETLQEIIGICGSFLAIRQCTIYLVHQSAKDFLLTKELDTIFPSGLGEVHHRIFSQSLQVMSETLRRDMYKLDHPGTCVNDIKPPNPDPLAAVQYPCVYWVEHLRSIPNQILDYENELSDNGAIFAFLKRHFLYWLEALSLIEGLSESIDMINNLLAVVDPAISTELSGFLRDAKRFVLSCRSIADSSPLQLYSSALIFAPKASIIRNTFQTCIPSWISQQPEVESGWNALQQTLEGHSDWVMSVAFSHDSKLLASASGDKTVKIWDTSTGSLQQTLEGHSDSVKSIAFSHDSKLLASASGDKTVKIWDTSTGSLQQTLEGHSDWVMSVAFSHDSKLLASASGDKTVKIWDTSTGSLQQTLEGHSDWVKSIAFSHDSKLLASASGDKTVKIWDTSTGSLQQTVAVNTYITSLSFDSTDSNLLMNGGSIKVDRTGLLSRSEHPQEGRDEGGRQRLGISRSWVTWNTQNLLWLPPDYRARKFDISPSGSIVAGGCSTGKVFIIGFLLANLMQHFG